MAPDIDSSGGLLLGLLALREAVIDQAQLIAAFETWMQAGPTTLGEILVRRGDLDSGERVRLEKLVITHLESRQSGPELSLTVAYQGSSPFPAGADSPASPSRPPATIAPREGHYQILRSHARGGLGEVLVALDTELGRRVALKVIQSSHANDPVSQARFLLEAQVTSGLEHPGIVPVYGLGRDAAGRPYYVMRFIEGETLKASITRFHGHEGRSQDPRDRDVSFRRLLQSFVVACNAVAYAHSRGVVHRDLKPENIMLGPFGETMVVDWGIVKTLENREPEYPTRRGATADLQDAALTLPGSTVGTPRYMSPEQASGRLDEVGTASDIYSLGATLYCLLVGHAPFPEDDVTEVLDRVRRGIFPSPRRLRRDLDPVLEAICLKAMSLRPEERYGRALELAAELEQWLADVRYRGDQVRAINEVKGSFSRLCIERAQNLFGRERHDEGLLWLARAMENLPADSPGLERVVRSNLGSWHARSRLLERTVHHRATIQALAFSPDGHRLATAGQDEAVRLWDVATGRGLRATPGSTGLITSLAFSPDGTTLATGGQDGTLRLWDAVIETERAAPIAHDGPIVAIRFSPDGSFLAAATRASSPSLVCARSGKVLRAPAGTGAPFVELAFGPGSEWLAAAHEDGRIACWSIQTGRLQQKILEHSAAVTSLAFHPDGKTVLTGCVDHKARLWELGEGRCLGEISMPAEIRRVAFEPGGRVIATLCGNGSARLWHSNLAHPIGETLVHDAAIECLAFSSDGTLLATAGRDRTTRLWDSSSGLPVGPPLEHRGMASSICFSGDGRRLAAGCSDGYARLWRVAPQIPGSTERIACWVRVTTDMDFDSGDAICKLDPLAGWELRRRLHELGGPPPAKIERW